MLVGIVSTGLGNAAAIARMYESLGVPVRHLERPIDVEEASHLVLPGVGHFRYGMERLRHTGWDLAVKDFTRSRGRPLLGVCLGAQLLGLRSEEGQCDGLGLIPIESVRMQTDLPVPNMGWREVTYPHDMLELGSSSNLPRYYFSHSYEMIAKSEDCSLGTFTYDGTRVAVIRIGNIVACQFHPEKSHRYGKHFLSWFSAI